MQRISLKNTDRLNDFSQKLSKMILQRFETNRHVFLSLGGFFGCFFFPFQITTSTIILWASQCPVTEELFIYLFIYFRRVPMDTRGPQGLPGPCWCHFGGPWAIRWTHQVYSCYFAFLCSCHHNRLPLIPKWGKFYDNHSTRIVLSLSDEGKRLAAQNNCDQNNSLFKNI